MGRIPTARSASTQSKKWPAFDGLRAIAILGVMAYHLADPQFGHGGYLGVDVFFVLSGFLITWLLLAEVDRTERVDIRSFYFRRALRLLPALAAVIAASVALVILDTKLGWQRHSTLIWLPLVILYSGNWVLVFKGLYGLGILANTWSLAVEEQFYIVWPLALTRLLRRFDRVHLGVSLIIIAVVEMVTRFSMDYAGVGWWSSYFSTLTHSDGLLVGCAIALCWERLSATAFWRVLQARRRVVSGAAILALLATFQFGSIRPVVMGALIAVAVILSALLVVTTIDERDGWVAKVLHSPPAQWIGVRSYGLYLWHGFIYVWMDTLFVHGRRQEALSFGGSLIAAALSYRVVEYPFLRLKNRFTVIPQALAPEPKTSL